MTGRGLSLLRDNMSWPIERDGRGLFRWTRPEFEIEPDSGANRFVAVEFASLPQDNALFVGGRNYGERIPLVQGWQKLDLAVHDHGALKIVVDKPHRARLDDRSLGLMVREVVPHADDAAHDRACRRHRNAYLNEREFLSGNEVLESAPPMLRITTSTACNIANEKPCVYCAWDWAKKLEQGSPECTPEFLKSLGRYIDLAARISDCSYGEPPLAARLEELLEIATAGNRQFEFTTNGQTLSRKVRQKLLGKTIRVYVSADAGSADGYNRYRDHRFNLLMTNLSDLCRDKRAFGNLPEVYVSFIVMRSNTTQISPFVSLMKEVGVDGIVFRSLYEDEDFQPASTKHNGFNYDYVAERLSFAEMQAISENCRALAGQAGLEIIVEWDAFAKNASAPAPGTPICSEPWKTAYVLNRGFIPCTYVREPVVRWQDIDPENIEPGIGAALNSEPYRELRRDLARGRLGKVCEHASGCPIVRAKKVGDLRANGR